MDVRKKKRNSMPNLNERKKRAVEHPTARLLQDPGLTVRQNARIRPRDGKGDLREIDVLITSSGPEFMHRSVVECKNEGKRTGIGRLDEFIGKLGHLGIGTDRGVYVSASGYTRGAVKRAVMDQVLPLVLTGLAPDRLGGQRHEARQTKVYLLLDLQGMRIRGESRVDAKTWEVYSFRDRDGRIWTCADLVWRKWITGEPPDILGGYELTLDNIPDDWRWLAAEDRLPKLTTANVRVVGLLMTIAGSAEQYGLINAATNNVERFQVEASFDPIGQMHPITPVFSEAELRAVLDRPGFLHVSTGRERLPRIKFNMAYWPMSDRVRRLFEQEEAELRATGTFDPNVIMDTTLEELEGLDLRMIFNPVRPPLPPFSLG